MYIICIYTWYDKHNVLCVYICIHTYTCYDLISAHTHIYICICILGMIYMRYCYSDMTRCTWTMVKVMDSPKSVVSAMWLFGIRWLRTDQVSTTQSKDMVMLTLP